MAFVVTLEDFFPSPRFDGTPWVQAKVEESSSPTGTFTELATFALAPFDLDPENPGPRSFTVTNAQLADGWYRVTFLDTAGNTQPVDPVHNVAATGPEYVPTVRQIGALLRSRTVDTYGTELGLFTSATRPTSAEAQELAVQGAEDVALGVGNDIPDGLIDTAQRLAAIRAAMLIELSYFPEQVSTNRSAYTQYKELWDEAMGTPDEPGWFVRASLALDPTPPTDTPGMPYFQFSETPLIGIETVM